GLAIDHLERLLRLRRFAAALTHCERYLAGSSSQSPSILVLRAEILAALGRYGAARDDVTTIRSTLGKRPNALTADECARVARVAGLAAAANADYGVAARELDRAEQLFRDAGTLAENEDLRVDRLRIGLRRGDAAAAAET